MNAANANPHGARSGETPLPKSCVAILFLLWAAGCGTIQGRHQRVRISTDVDRAQVFYQGKRLGAAPGLLKLPRARGLDLEIRSENQGRKARVESKYRWAASFTGNLAFAWVTGGFGAIGFIIDHVTGAAWNLIEPPATQFWPDKSFKPLEPESISVFPPESSSLTTSVEVATQIAEKLRRRYPNTKILSHGSQSHIYEMFEVSHNKGSFREASDFQIELLHKLRSSHVALTRILVGRRGQVLETKIVDSRRWKVVDVIKSDLLANSQDDSNSAVSWFKDWGLGLVPNTIGIAKTSQTFWGLGYGGSDMAYHLKEASKAGFLGSGFSLTATHLRHRYKRKEFGFVFRWTGSVTASSMDVNLTSSDPFLDFQKLGYHWYRFGIGLGPEIGLELSPAYYYISVIAEPTYHMIQPRGSYQGSELSDWSTEYSLEVGLSVFIDERWAGRLYGSTTTAYIWNDLLKLEGASESPESASIYEGGFVIEYYLPESKGMVHKALK